MTLYKKSQLFMVWIFVLFFTFPLWITLLENAFGTAGMWVGGAFWLSHGALAMYAFRCPSCGLSPFVSNKGFIAVSTPWPRKICGHCGRNHDADEVS